MGSRFLAWWVAVALLAGCPGWADEPVASRSEPAPEEGTPAPAPPRPGTFSDPNESRLMFAPTGRPLGKGNGYFSDHYVVFPGVAYGLTRNLSIGGGFSFVPGLGLDEQAFYVNLGSGFEVGRSSAVAIGGFLAGAGTEDVADFALGGLYGVASFGPSDRSLSIGVAAVAQREEEYRYSPTGEYLETARPWRFRDAPVLMLGGSLRLSRNVSLISESWLVLSDGVDLSQQPFGLAVRFFNGRLSADVGVILVGEALREGLPVPWLSFSYHFGPSRSKAAVKSTAPAMPGWAGAGRGGR
jgi:hypothetical protein